MGESPEECLLREVKEETGLTLCDFRFCGLVTFLTNHIEETEYMCLYHSKHFTGDLITCDEGELEWVDKQRMYELNLWEGDKIFFQLMDERRDFFSLKLRYDEDKLVEVRLDGKAFDLEGWRRRFI